jgi:hypothetical protein
MVNVASPPFACDIMTHCLHVKSLLPFARWLVPLAIKLGCPAFGCWAAPHHERQVLMTVAELIKELTVHPLDRQVQCIIPGDADAIPIKAVDFDDEIDLVVFLVLDF